MLEKWALVAEIASAVAVVVTLVFLLVGIRENTNATQASVYEELVSELNEHNRMLVDDSLLARLWLDRFSVGIDEMKSDDAARVIFMNRMLFRVFDAAYYSFRNGSLGRSQWERFQAAICANYPSQQFNEKLNGLWEQTYGASLSFEFVSYIEEECPREP